MSKKEEGKLDLRVYKTQTALASAMLALLEKQSFQKITVNDICLTAMVSRATFYMHFEDKYHLLRFSLSQMKERLQSEMKADCCVAQEELFARMIDVLSDHKNLFRNIFFKDSSQELQRMLSDFLVENITQQLTEQQKNGFPLLAPIPLLAVFLAGGMVHVLLWWLEGGFTISREEMIAHMMKMSEGRMEIARIQ